MPEVILLAGSNPFGEIERCLFSDHRGLFMETLRSRNWIMMDTKLAGRS
jgi:hypothetical protein